MKQVLSILFATVFFACNNSKNEKTDADKSQQPATNTPAENTTSTTPPPAAGSAAVIYTVDGVEISNYASILVTKDKDINQADAPYLCMLTSNAATHNNEYLTVNFLMNTKPGTYPVTGTSLQRGKDDKSEMYGSMLGGKPKLTEYKVTITECKDLGSNNMGGHRWSISGTWEGFVIKATPMMLIDNKNNHPAEVKLGKGTFTNLTFDDNWEEMMEKAMDQMKKND